MADQRGGWTDLTRTTPLGVLIIGAMLAFLGAGLVLGGAYLTITAPGGGWAPVLGGLCAGALTLYVALHLVRLTHWAWHAILLLLALLLASSLWRLAAAPSLPIAPAGEIAVELLVLYYLTRRPVRVAFARR